MRKQRGNRLCHGLDMAGTGFIAATLLVALTIAVPYANAGKKKKQQQDAADSAPVQQIQLSKAFKGKLPIAQLTEDEAIIHALNRLAYGPRPGDVERVRQMGLEKWIQQQLNPDSLSDAAVEERLSDYKTLNMSSEDLLREFPPPDQAAKREGLTKEQYQEQQKEKARAEMQQMRQDGIVDQARMRLVLMRGPQRIIAELSMAKLTRAMYSERQLGEVMNDFWFNHFNVFAGKGADRWLLTSYERDTIRPHSMGKFQDLLLATAQSPAMLFYLDNWMSADPVASQKLNRELAQRRQRFQGIFGAFPPRAAAGANGQPQPNRVPPQQQERGLNENYGREVMELHTLGVDGGYTQQDVIEMAKCLTGWTMRGPRRDPEFRFEDRLHTPGPKYVLGKKIDYGGMRDGKEALKLLAHHPSTARFISTELARHFVSDNPPQALVDRMAQTFLSSDGDIRAILRTMIYSPEFWSRSAYRAKVKTPFELAVSTARAIGARIDLPFQLAQWVGRMGEPLYLCQPPTGYSDKAETWVNTGALLNRLNFALALSTNHLAGGTTDLSSLFGPEASADPHMALSRAIELFLGGQIAPETRSTLEARLDDPAILQARLDDPVKHVNEGLIAGLVLGAPEFQRR